jgi:hypothetical protein
MVLGSEKFPAQRNQVARGKSPSDGGAPGAKKFTGGGGVATARFVDGWHAMAHHEPAAGGGCDGKVGVTCGRAFFPPAIL